MKKITPPKEFSIASIYEVYQLNKLVFVAIFLLITIFAAFYSMVAPQKFASDFSLLPPLKSESGMGISSVLSDLPAVGGLGGKLGGGGSKTRIFKEVLESRTVADYVFENTALSDTNYFNFETRHDFYQFYNKISDIYVSRNEVLSMSFVVSTKTFPSKNDISFSKTLVADIANAAVKGLDSLMRNKNMSSARQSKEYIDVELVRYSKQLDSVQNEIEIYQTKNNVLEIENQTEAILSQAIELSSQLAIAELDLNLAKLEYSTSSSQYIAIKNTYETILQQYNKIQSGGLTDDDAFSIPLKKIPALIREYTDLFRSQKVLEQVIFYLQTQRHQEAIQEQKDVPAVEMLDSPKVPERRVSPNRKIMVIIGMIVALFFDGFLLVFYAFYSRSVYLKKAN